MNIHHLDEEVVRLTRFDNEASVGIGHEGVGGPCDNGQPNGSEHTVSVDTEFMTANAGGGPTSIVEEHFQGDVFSVQRPVESEISQLVAVGIIESRIEVQLTVGGHTTPFPLKRDESQTTRSDIKG